MQRIHSPESLPAKLSRPRLHCIYPRKRIFKAISERKKYGALWISGPAGSGKTTVINSYLEKFNIPCLWYTLDQGDSDIASFFYYMGKAASQYCRSDAQLPPRFTPDYFTTIPIFSKRYFEKLFSLLPSPCALVFDDHHEVFQSSLLNKIVSDAISQLPEHIHLWVIGRENPPKEMARLRANRRLDLLGWEYLRLDLSETCKIVRTAMGREVMDGVVAEIHRKTDGWVAGVLLLLKCGEPEFFKPQLLSEHAPQEIFDYFSSELFDKLQKNIQNQMLQFAFLPRISVEAAKKMTRSKDAVELLRYLHKGNMFLTRLKGEKRFYQFHPLLRDFLQMRARKIFSDDELKYLMRKSASLSAEDGNMEETVKLYIAAGDASEAAKLILSQAALLANQGRFQTLEALIRVLPKDVKKDSPWFIYWQAACRIPYSVRKSADIQRISTLNAAFMRAFTLFEEAQDPLGCYLALSGILESIYVGMDDFTLLDPWIDKLDELCLHWKTFPPSNAIPWLIPAVIGALVVRRPTHPALLEWVAKGMRLLKSDPDSSVAIRSFLPMVLVRLLKGEFVAAEQLFKMFKWRSGEKVSPLGSLLFETVYSFYCWQAGRFGECIRIADRAVAFEKEVGIHLMIPQVHGAVGAIENGDLELAGHLLGRVEPMLMAYGKLLISYFYTVAGWLSMLKEDLVRLKFYSKEGLSAAEKAGCPLTLPVHYLQSALTDHLAGLDEAAETHLKRAIALSQQVQAHQVMFGCYLAEAEFALSAGSDAELTQALKNALRIGRQNGFVSTYFWRPAVIAKLCVEALKKNIEIPYVKKLVNRQKPLSHRPPIELDKWPWPVRIRTFGAFSLEVNEIPVLFSGKIQRRPLSLLKYLLAAGPADGKISDVRIQDALWPDADGDHAQMAFKATLHRLRKLLGNKNAVILNAGYLALNENLCWTDLWAFKDLCDKIKSLQRDPDSLQSARHIFDRLLMLYRGPFLPDEEACWIIQMRRRSATQFTGSLLKCIQVIRTYGTAETVAALENRLQKPPTGVPLDHLLKKLKKRANKK